MFKEGVIELKWLWQEFYRPLPVVILLGIGAALYFGVIGSVWAVTGEFTRWGGHLLQLFGYPIEDLSYLNIIKMKGLPWDRTDGWVVFGMFAGALTAALAGSNWKLRIPAQKRRLLQGLIGGMIAGFGARLAMGCNLAALFTGVPQFSLHAIIFTIATLLGTWIGLKISLLPWMLGTPKLTATKGQTVKAVSSQNKSRQPMLAIILAIIFIAIIARYFTNDLTKLAWAGVFGWIFGWLIEKGQICFTSAFRDLWISGRTTILKALIVGMAIQAIGTAYFIAQGTPAKVMWAGPSVVIGGLLFGIGIVIAGGCETGWMYRAMEGQVHFWFVGIGNIIGATVLTLVWDHGVYQTLVAPFPKVDLVKTFGWLGAFAIVYGFLLLLYLFARYMEKKKSFTSMVKLPVDLQVLSNRKIQ